MVASAVVAGYREEAENDARAVSGRHGKGGVPWAVLVALMEPHYPKAGKGPQPRGLETWLRIYFMQRWFALSDPGMEDILEDVPCMRASARLDLRHESVPDATTILKCRRRLN